MRYKTLFFLFCLVCSASALSVEYYTPTPLNNTVLNVIPQNISIHAVIDIGGNPLSLMNYTWNGTTYSLYDSSLLASLNMDNNSIIGDTLTNVFDIGLNKNNGTIIGAKSVSGKYGNGYSLDGTTGRYIIIPGVATTNFTKVAFSIWVKPIATPAGYARIVDKTYANNFLCAMFASSLTVGCWWGGSADSFTSSSPMVQGQWNNLIYSHNGTYAKMFINGLQVAGKATTKVPSNSLTNVIALGCGSDADSSVCAIPFNGTLDEFRLWNRDLSATEVQVVYLSNLYKFNASWYDFSIIQSVNTAGLYSYTVSGQDNLDYFGSSTFNIYVNTTNYTIAPRVSLCSPSVSSIQQGSEMTVESYFTQFTNPLDTGWFTINETFKNSTKAVSGYNYLTWKTSTELGNYSIRCWVNDSQGNSHSLYDGWVNVYAATTTTTIAPRISSCEPSQTNVLQGSELTIQTYVTQFTNPLSQTWFTINETFKNSTQAVGGYNNIVWKTSTELGNYSIRCWVNDTVNNKDSLLDSWVSIYTTTTTTTTTLPYNTTRVCLTNSSYSTDVTYLCYQETATSPTSCGGLGTGSYLCTGNWTNCTWNYDGNWISGTHAQTNQIAYLYINYTKPINALNALLLSEVATYADIAENENDTIPSSCFNKYSNTLSFTIISDYNTNVVSLYCYNGTDVILRSETSPIDEIYMYEEGMWWVIANATNNYTLSFKEEETGNTFNFSRHPDSYLDVICPTYGSDRLVLTYTTPINITTREQPILKAVVDNGLQLRQLKLTQTGGDISMYLIDGTQSLYRFDLYDYTNKQRGGVLKVQTTVNNTLQTINYNTWDANGQQTFSLRPNWPYTFTLDNLAGSVVQYGSLSIGNADLIKQIVVNKIDLNDKDIDNYGGLTFKFTGNDTNRLGLIYNKSVGNIAVLTYNVSYAANKTIAYSTIVYSTSNGELYFNVPNVNYTYIQTAEFQLDNGKTIISRTLGKIFNGTLDFHLIPEATTEIWGVKSETLLNGMSMVYIGAIFIAGTAWNPEVAMMGVGMGVVLSTFNVLTGIPLWFWTLLFLMALGMTLAKGRPQPV